jgi:ribosomal protein S12
MSSQNRENTFSLEELKKTTDSLIIANQLLGLSTKAPNSAVREMAQNNLIDNPDLWFDFLIARNKTSHTYAEDMI